MVASYREKSGHYQRRYSSLVGPALSSIDRSYHAASRWLAKPSLPGRSDSIITKTTLKGPILFMPGIDSLQFPCLSSYLLSSISDHPELAQNLAAAAPTVPL